jgi:hypothetical protein
MEPENSTIQKSQPLEEGIVTADVLAFVRQHGV